MQSLKASEEKLSNIIFLKTFKHSGSISATIRRGNSWAKLHIKKYAELLIYIRFLIIDQYSIKIQPMTKKMLGKCFEARWQW